MTRFTMKLLQALVVVGCGSNAMAAQGHGYWTGYGDPSQTTPYPDQSQTQALVQGPPGQTQPQAQPSPNVGPSDPWAGQSQDQDQDQDQDQGQNQNAAPAQPSQGADPLDDQDQDEDAAERAPADQDRLGVLVMGLTPELRRHFGAPINRGVLIARVEPGSAATRAGIEVGDVLVRVGRQPVRSGDDVVQALAARGGERIPLSVIRAGRLVRLAAMMSAPQPRAPAHPLHDL